MALFSAQNRRRPDPVQRREEMRALGKRVGTIVAYAVAAALGAYAAVHAATATARWLTTSPDWALTRVRYAGLVHATADELNRLGEIAFGGNLVRIDLAATERRLRLHPWVRAVKLTRELPHTLRADVLEWTAAATIDLGRLYLVSPEGEVFRRVAPGDDLDLPVITGLTREGYVERRGEATSMIVEAVAAARAYAELPFARREPLSEMRIDPTEGVTLLAGSDAFVVKLGFAPFDEKLARLVRLHEEVSRGGARAQVIRLDNARRPGWVAVRLDRGAVRPAADRARWAAPW